MSRMLLCWGLVFAVQIVVFQTAVCQAQEAAKTEAPAAPAADPYDWPYWRGPEMNGISREKGLISSWSPEGENLLWRNPELATRSTPIVLRGKLYTICRYMPETTSEGEMVVCADLETGKILWQTSNNIYLSDAPAERVGWNSVYGDPETGNIFFLGLGGAFRCLDGNTGKELWSHSMLEEYGILSTYGGRTNYPFIFEDLVLVSGVMTGWGEAAIPAYRIIAFDKRNGQAVWLTSTRLRPEDTTYSSPVLGVFNGQAAIVVGAGDGSVYAIQPRTGKVIWQYDASIRGINQTPLVIGNTVYCSHGEETVQDNSVVGAIFALKGDLTGNITKTGELWNLPGMAVARSAPLVVDNRLYIISDGAGLTIHDATTGKDVGKQKLGTIMFGSPVYGDGKIYVGESTGRWYILEPSEKGVKILHKLRLDDEEILGSPIISHGKVILPTLGAMYCLGVKDQAPSGDPVVALPPESPKDEDLKPASAQLVPVESLLKPNQGQQFQVRLYNAKGRFLKLSPAKYTLEGSGKIDDSGKYQTAVDHAHTVTIVKAEVEGLTATARIRTIPALPWKFDFNDKLIPPTWIGAAYRHVPRDVDAESLMVKVTTIPKGTRSQSWMGHPNLSGYTINAEVWGDLRNEKIPEMGVINQRYTLALMGAAQSLQLRSWTPRLELRFAHTVPFAWKPKTWYVMKLRADNVPPEAPTKVVLKGKVWPRGEPEPEAWTIVGEDAVPNLVGSPGLFGNSSDAEVYYDNVTVVPNEK